MLRCIFNQNRAFPFISRRFKATSATGAARAATAAAAATSPTVAPMFDKILVANRGEIACRVFRTAHRLGISTVAVYSDADKMAQHTHMASEAVHIGPPPAAASYLQMEKILDAAKRTKSQAIHPGYGFLSENAQFAAACEAAGVQFIGPPSSAIAAMGSKSAAKDIMTKANVPCVPGYHGEDQSYERFEAEVEAMGYPVLFKPVLGGGGKGMRIVRARSELKEAIDASRREGESSFGDGRLLVEKYIERPRHIEIQLCADRFGQVVHLFERDCSLQRRYQKIIEEAPAPGMSEAMRAAMGATACDAARAVGYENAGTVEFILDADTNQYYFMEMNTRLQVEHPVSEAITGVDLVEWQLLVAAGRPLPRRQEELKVNGHAIEARVYAESEDFLPQSGRLLHVRTPPPSSHVRVDTGVGSGDEVSIYYDPMIAKLIVWDVDREAALRRMRRAISSYEIVGVPTNLAFCRAICAHPAFIQGDLDTSFIPKYKQELLDATTASLSAHRRAVVLAAAATVASEVAVAGGDVGAPLRVNSSHERRLTFLTRHDDEEATVLARYSCDGDASRMSLEVCVAEPRRRGDDEQPAAAPLQCFTAPLHILSHTRYAPTASAISVELGQERFEGTVVSHVSADGEVLTVSVDGVGVELRPRSPLDDFGDAAAGAGDGVVLAPMPGKVLKLSVAVGDEVRAGDAVCTMEAMKMEHVMTAAVDGVVVALGVVEGDLVLDRAMLVKIEKSDD